MRKIICTLFLTISLCGYGTGCDLIGPTMYDPTTGEVLVSPLKASMDALVGQGSDIAPGIINDAIDGDGLSTGSQTAIGTVVLGAILAGVGAFRRRKKLKRK